MKISIPEAAVNAVMGYVVVFVGLALLMAVIVLMGKIMVASQAKAKAQAQAKAVPHAQPAAAAQPEPAGIPAPGSAGEVKLFDVPDKEAAMLMAIVADKMGKPLNELRFKSMKEVK